MITRIAKRTLYDKNSPENKPYWVGNSDSVILMITVRTGGATGFLTFNGSADEKGFDPLQPAGENNFFTKVAVNDIDTGKTYEGSIGVSVATQRLLMVEVNTRFINYLHVDDSLAGGADCKIDIVCIQN